MNKSELINVLDEIFTPLGYKRHTNNWTSNGEEIAKVVNLQKSRYGNAFYINYGYIIRHLELSTITHVENRLASMDKSEQKRITELLNLDVYVDAGKRLAELKECILDKIVSKMQSINTEKDILTELRNRPHLNDIPLVVKKHFHLEGY